MFISFYCQVLDETLVLAQILVTAPLDTADCKPLLLLWQGTFVPQGHCHTGHHLRHIPCVLCDLSYPTKELVLLLKFPLWQKQPFATTQRGSSQPKLSITSYIASACLGLQHLISKHCSLAQGQMPFSAVCHCSNIYCTPV